MVMAGCPRPIIGFQQVRAQLRCRGNTYRPRLSTLASSLPVWDLAMALSSATAISQQNRCYGKGYSYEYSCTGR